MSEKCVDGEKCGNELRIVDVRPGVLGRFERSLQGGRVAVTQMLQAAHDKGQISVPDLIQASLILKSLLFGDKLYQYGLEEFGDAGDVTLHDTVLRAVRATR